MDDADIRQLRRLQIQVSAAAESIDRLRDRWQDKQAQSKEVWRLSEVADIALGDALSSLSGLIDLRERGLERNSEEAAPVKAARRGGLRMTLLKSERREHPPLFCPMVYCDHCGNRIEGAGNALYEVAERTLDPLTGEIYFFHKGCDRPFEKQQGGRWFWDELQWFPARLAANLSLRVNRTSGGRWVIDKGASAITGTRGDQPTVPGGALRSERAPRPVSLDPQRNFSALQKEEILQRCNGHCASCGQELGLDWHADHIYPHSRGGVTEVQNGQALCIPCNQRKRDHVLTVEEGEE